MQKKPIIPVITIDGPSGSGKGTISKLLAKKLGWHLLDSGALYRVLALAAYQHDVALDNELALEKLAVQLNVQFIVNALGEWPRIVLEGTDVTAAIRSEACGNAASKIAVLAKVRSALLACQRAFQKAPGLVADGRDMGTVIFPQAPLKIFLQASAEQRAKRRVNQLLASGNKADFNQVYQELLARDARDQARSVAPLRPAEDAVVVDTTHLNIDEVLQVITQHVQKLL